MPSKRALAVLLATSVAGGCGPALVHTGAHVTGNAVQSGTTAVASGGTPSGGDAAIAALGVALMVAGARATPPAARQYHPPTPVIPPRRR